MRLLQGETERSNHPLFLTQSHRYMSHSNKHAGKSASSVVITVRAEAELMTLKGNKVTVLYDPRKVTEYIASRATKQCCRCVMFLFFSVLRFYIISVLLTSAGSLPPSPTYHHTLLTVVPSGFAALWFVNPGVVRLLKVSHRHTTCFLWCCALTFCWL